jgi:hypothetical protein
MRRGRQRKTEKTGIKNVNSQVGKTSLSANKIMITKILKEALSSGEIISVYANPGRPSSCSVGSLIEMNSDILVIKSLTPDGVSDGVILRKRAHVSKIERGGIYEKKIAFLLSRKVSSGSELFSVKIRNFLEAFRAAKKHKVVVSIWLETDDDDAYASGLVGDIGKNTILLSKIDDYGRSEGEVCFQLSDVEAIDIDGDTERRLALLNANLVEAYGKL